MSDTTKQDAEARDVHIVQLDAWDVWVLQDALDTLAGLLSDRRHNPWRFYPPGDVLADQGGYVAHLETVRDAVSRVLDLDDGTIVVFP